MRVNSRGESPEARFSVDKLRAGALSILFVTVLLISAGAEVAAAQPPSSPLGASSVAQASPASGGSADACVTNGYLAARVDDLTGIYSFDSGDCPAMTASPDYILFPLGTSWLTVADFTSGNYYTEAGRAGADSLGTPTSSVVVGDSIITTFPETPEGLVVTQNLTVLGGNYSASVITMSVSVVNDGPEPQQVGVRYLWNLDVGGYGGTWLQQYDNLTAGSITGYETSYASPPDSFSSYAISGCAQGAVVPPPYVCDPSNFGTGTFVAYGSVSAGPGATQPARLVYGWWDAISDTAYGYTANPSDELGSYVPNVSGQQDSAVLYYFANSTIPAAGGSLSDQADVGTSPFVYHFQPTVTLDPNSGPAGTKVSVTGYGLAPTGTVTMTSFGGLAAVALSGTCTVDSAGNLTSSGGCGFTVPNSIATGTYTLAFSDGRHTPTADFAVTPAAGTTSKTKVGCRWGKGSSASVLTCTAKVSGDTPVGMVSWAATGNGAVAFNSDSCTLVSGGCSVTMDSAASGVVQIAASYGGDSSNAPSTGVRDVVIGKGIPVITVTCDSSEISVGASMSCTVTLTGGFDSPSGKVTWTRDEGWWRTSTGFHESTGYASFSPKTCTLAAGSCTITLTATRSGTFRIKVFYSGDANNAPEAGWSVTLILT